MRTNFDLPTFYASYKCHHHHWRQNLGSDTVIARRMCGTRERFQHFPRILKWENLRLKRLHTPKFSYVLTVKTPYIGHSSTKTECTWNFELWNSWAHEPISFCSCCKISPWLSAIGSGRCPDSASMHLQCRWLKQNNSSVGIWWREAKHRYAKLMKKASALARA